MSLRVGLLSAAHVHAYGLAHNIRASAGAELAGLWDDDSERGQKASTELRIPFESDRAAFLGNVDAVVICSENTKHAEHVELAAAAGKAILCEKPVAVSADHAERIRIAVEQSGVPFMTAFPCPFSPAFEQFQSRIHDGAIGKVVGWNTTNQGTCPFGWFVQPELSGGGALVDHVVHVLDLLRRLTKSEPVWVQAFTGNGMYGQAWDDIAAVTVGFGDGSFATIDSSWSKVGYKTWGNVKLKAVGTAGTAEADLFGQGPDLFVDCRHHHLGGGSDLNQLMVQDFIDAVTQNRSPRASLEDGLAASRVVVGATESVRQGGEKVSLTF